MVTTAEAAAIITRNADPQGNGFGIAADISYSFFGGAFAFTAAQQMAALAAMQLWSDVARLNFFVDNADPEIGFVNFSDGSVTSSASTSWNDGDFNPDTTHTLGFNLANEPGTQLAPGQFAFQALTHELGHAIGFEHPGDYNAGPVGSPPITYENSRGYDQDSLQYTVMSYWSETKTGADFNGQISRTPLIQDIAAAQQFYGANMLTRTGDTIYGFHSNAGAIYTLSSASEQAVFAIWDAGGIDTFDLSGYSQDQIINLTVDGFSNTGGLTANMSMADAVDMFGNNSWEAGFDATQIANLIENAIGGTGNDIIFGNQANNALDGGDGNDDLEGRAGNDILIGGSGGDILDGGSGFDKVIYNSVAGETVTITPFGAPNAGIWTVTGPGQALGDSLNHVESFAFGAGNDIITLLDAAGVTSLSIDGASGDDNITGSNGLTDIDTLIGGDGKDTISTLRGVFNAYGGSLAGLSSNWVESLADNDTLIVDRSYCTARYDFTVTFSGLSLLGTGVGTDGSTARGFAELDYLGSEFVDSVSGLLGDDTLRGQGGEDALIGRTGNDILDGGSGNDYLSGDDGNDTVSGGSGFDIIFAGIGNDVLNGGIGNDQLFGSDGNDILLGGAGVDKMIGGIGDDRIETGGGGSETGYGEAGNDTLIGSADSEALDGGIGDDKLTGLAGNDQLFGGDGNDRYDAGAGDDVINTGLGIETVDGGADNDILSMNRSAMTVGVSFFLNGPVGSDGSSSVNIETLSYNGGSGSDTVRGGSGLDYIYGGSGNDVLDGGVGNDQLFGSDGNDTILGGAGVDSMFGGIGDDRIETGGGHETGYGEAGNDTLIGSADSEALDGGIGDDKLTGLAGNDQLFGGDGNDRYDAGAGDDVINTGLGIETVDGGADNDILSMNRSAMTVGVSFFLNGPVGSDGSSSVNIETLSYNGGSGSDTVRGGSGLDYIYGGSGNDVLDGGVGNDQLFGSDGNDTILGGAGVDSMFGGIGDDRIETGGGHETGYGEAGNDTLIGSADSEALDGGIGDDKLTGLAGNDQLFGGDGNDRYDAGAGDDVINTGLGIETVDGGADNDILSMNRSAMTVGVSFFLNGPVGSDGSSSVNIETLSYNGGSGSDTVRGGSGLDYIYGGSGNDVLDGGVGNDQLFGGDGNDTILGGAGVDSMFGGIGDDRIETGGGHETGYGEAGNDTLIGSADSEALDGGIGDDKLTGLAGNDQLFGGDGRDILIGGAGNDILNGGTGVDFFLFNTALNAVGNVDIVNDLAAVDDTIQLDSAIFTGLAKGILAIGAFHIGVTAADASDRILYNAATGSLSFDADGTGPTAQIIFAMLNNLASVTNDDFQVI